MFNILGKDKIDNLALAVKTISHYKYSDKDMSEYILFNSEENYVNFVRLWKKDYKDLTSEIRKLREDLKIEKDIDKRSFMQSKKQELRCVARKYMELRMFGKKWINEYLNLQKLVA